MNIKTHTIRLFPSPSQEIELKNLNRLRNIIWNKLLTIHNDHYNSTKKSLSDFELMNFITQKQLRQSLNNLVDLLDPSSLSVRMET